MKYFDELKMADIQKAFDSEVLEWKGVTSKPMMGCQCYFHGRKFICFLVTDGIVLMKLSDKDQDALKTRLGGKPFEMAGQTGRLWVTPLKALKDLKQVMPFVKKRYEEIASTKPKTHRLLRVAIGRTRKKTRTGWVYASGRLARFCLNRFRTHQRDVQATSENPTR